MIIDLPPHIEQVIIAKAQAEHISVADLITKWAKQETDVNPMIEAVMKLEPSAEMKKIDAVALQREWRNEWR